MTDDKQRLDAIEKLAESTAVNMFAAAMGAALWGLILPSGAVLVGFGVVLAFNLIMDYRTYLKAKYQ